MTLNIKPTVKLFTPAADVGCGNRTPSMTANKFLDFNILSAARGHFRTKVNYSNDDNNKFYTACCLIYTVAFFLVITLCNRTMSFQDNREL